MNILHIAAHLGGGAGKAISGMAIQGKENFPDIHKILLLQYPEKSRYVRECQENGVWVGIWNGDETPLKWADVIVVSWWNHPLMARFLRTFPLTSRPMILWSHVNGCHYPMLSCSFIDRFDRVLFTSPYSLKNPVWTSEESERVGACSEIVWGMGRFMPEQIEAKAAYNNQGNFTIGYIGTLNYGKLHPQFIAYCKAVCNRIPEAKFVMAGDRNEALKQEVHFAGLEKHFSFLGYVTDVPALMRSFDVFGYLLNPQHYGTTENVLLEAMACGVMPVVLRQNTEQSIVPPEEAYVIDGPEEYGARMSYLWDQSDRRAQLSYAARDYVRQHFDSAANTARFRRVCQQALEQVPKTHNFSFLGDAPWQWFLCCLDSKTRCRFEKALNEPEEAARSLLQTCPPILREERKSSLRHFAAIYPNDKKLEYFSRLLKR